METDQVLEIVKGFRQASRPGKVEDGQIIHIRYTPVEGKRTVNADLQKAIDIGMPLDSYTGSLSRLWQGKNGDWLMSMFVVLERDNKYRTFNLSKGKVLNIESLEGAKRN